MQPQEQRHEPLMEGEELTPAELALQMGTGTAPILALRQAKSNLRMSLMCHTMLSLIMGGFTVMTLDDTPTNAVVGVLWLTMTAVMLGSGVGVLCAKSRTAGRICWTLHGVGAAFNLIVFVVAAASLSASTDCNKHACMAHLILQVARAVMAITCLPCLQVGICLTAFRVTSNPFLDVPLPEGGAPAELLASAGKSASAMKLHAWDFDADDDGVNQTWV